jgi:hypothetical protein
MAAVVAIVAVVVAQNVVVGPSDGAVKVAVPIADVSTTLDTAGVVAASVVAAAGEGSATGETGTGPLLTERTLRDFLFIDAASAPS